MTTDQFPPNQERIVEFLHATGLFEGLPDQLVQTVYAQGKVESLTAGNLLFHQGEPAEALWLVLDGTLNARIARLMVGETDGGDYQAGHLVGVTDVLTGEARSSTVRAVTDVTLFRFDKDVLVELSQTSPDLLCRMGELVRRHLQLEQLAVFLPQMFGTLNDRLLREVESLIEWVYVNQGEPLLRQGTLGTKVFLLVSGYLYVVKEGRNGANRIINDIKRGELVGEMTFFTTGLRTASVYAARDSWLIGLSRQAFDKLLKQFPELMTFIIQTLIDRLRKKDGSITPKISNRYGTQRLATVINPTGHWSTATRQTNNIVIVPVSPEVRLGDFVERLQRALAKHGDTFALNSQRVNAVLDIPEIAQMPKEQPQSVRLTAWLDQQELNHRYMVYQTDPTPSEWTRRCIRRADQILLVGTADSSPQLSPIEDRFLSATRSLVTPPQSLVLLHPDRSRPPSGTAAWLEARDVDNHYHICWDRPEDFERLARLLTGRAVGVVLGGGGARGLAHVGVIRALQEAKIPIDLIGGTSMGALVAAECAVGWDPAKMITVNQRMLVDSRPLQDYTLPLLSLLSSRKVDRLYAEGYGPELRVEDLWVNFFCVSSNLSKAEMVVHREGLLWKAVRASSSLPGIFLPVIEGEDLLVDGAVFNNLPGDVMRSLGSGFTIVVNVSPEEDVRITESAFPSPWKLALRRLFGRPVPKVPNILDVMTRSALLSSIHSANQIAKRADLYLEPPVESFSMLDFAPLEALAEAGYQYTKERVKMVKF
ncbi:MAG: cyclic nucleotide-binding domain-containing protein [Blastocatellia bacterium]|nr:cyclic nucleotide-binding domain-containing protein [Blastocatellia bacterium]